MEVFTIRLMPGEDLQDSLKTFIAEKKLTNAFIITCVGSLTKANIRMANANFTKLYEGWNCVKFENFHTFLNILNFSCFFF